MSRGLGAAARLRLGAALVCALPWLAALPNAPDLFRALVGVTFLPLCHHVAGRVLVLGGDPMCVCSRCAGLYAGLAMGFLVGLPSLSSRVLARLVVGALGLACLDVLTQDLGLHAPWHATRLATGVLLGWTVAAAMVASLSRGTSSSGGARCATPLAAAS